MNQEDRESFHPIFIGSKQTIFKNILFNPIGDPDLKFPTFKEIKDIPIEDVWTLEYYILDSSAETFRIIKSQTFILSNEQIFMGSLIPDDQKLIKEIKKLKKIIKK